jgi:hypothetical protein
LWDKDRVEGQWDTGAGSVTAQIRGYFLAFFCSGSGEEAPQGRRLVIWAVSQQCAVQTKQESKCKG